MCFVQLVELNGLGQKMGFLRLVKMECMTIVYDSFSFVKRSCFQNSDIKCCHL